MWWLFSLLLSAPSVSLPLGDAPFAISADHLRAEPSRGLYHAAGRVHVKRGDLDLYADQMTYDERSKKALFEGHVFWVQGREVLSCARVELDVPGGMGEVFGAELWIKTSSTVAAQARTSTTPALGPNALIVTGERLERTGRQTLRIEQGSFTPCDCQDGTPLWRISSARATIDLDSGAWLTWPVLRVKDVPIFALPLFYLPLGDRRSGLLLPSAQFGAFTGFGFGLPLFLTLGRSYDLTLEPAYYLSRGFAPSLEFRWAPAPGSRGAAKLSLLHDYGEVDPEGGFRRGETSRLRFGLTGGHRGRVGEMNLASELALLSDPRYSFEFARGFAERQIEGSTSRVTLSSAREWLRVAFGVGLRQELRPRYYLGYRDLRDASLFSADRGPGDIEYRLAELRIDALPHRLTSVLPLYGRAELSAQGFLAPSPNRPRFARVDFRPELRLPLWLEFFGFEPSLALRLTGWSGRADESLDSPTRVAFIVAQRAELNLFRSYGEAVHRIRLEFKHLFIPALIGEGPGPFQAEDEIDLLAAAHQAAARLGTDWFSGGGRRFYADLWAAYDRDAGLSPLVVQAGGQLLRAPSLSASGLWSIGEDGTEELIAQLGLALPFGSLSLVGGRLSERLPRRTLIGPEEIAPSNTLEPERYLSKQEYGASLRSGQPNVSFWTPYRGLNLAARVRPLAELELGFVLGLDFEDPVLAPGVLASTSPVRNWGASARYRSRCRCLDAGLYVDFARGLDFPTFRFLFDVPLSGSVNQTLTP